MFVAENLCWISKKREQDQRRRRNKVKKTVLLFIAIFVVVFFVFALNPVSASGGTQKSSKGSMYVTGQIGLNSYVETAEPFDSMPFPVGASYEFFITDNIGLGGTVMFDKWCDYLGLYCGKFTFRVIRPSLDITYHFKTEAIKGLDFFAGTNLGYSILSVSNELCNDYPGDLQSEPLVAPFIGTHLYFWENVSCFLDKILVTFKVSWSLTGDFSGIYGAVGITYKIK
jgi:hypothetical protein